MSFETRLIAVKHLRAGQRVGYGGDWIARVDTLVGIAAAGYADGYPWHSSKDTPVVVSGRPARVIGRVSMDMISIDLTGLSGCRPGDPVVLWGDEPAVEEVARCAGTISYELLAAISPRVTRQIGD
jgi:alanine racemase